MVIQRAQDAVNNLKERPRDERKAVAAGIAIAVVAILFLAWAVIFFKKIQGGLPAATSAAQAGGADVDISALQGETIIENIQQP